MAFRSFFFLAGKPLVHVLWSFEFIIPNKMEKFCAEFLNWGRCSFSKRKTGEKKEVPWFLADGVADGLQV